MHAHAHKFGATFRSETVIGLADAGDLKIVSTRAGYHQAKTVIIATGIQRKELRVPGEKEFKGRGVSYCGICDGPFFRGKNVAIVGSGHEAVEDALQLADTVKILYAIPGKKGYSDKHHYEHLRHHPNVQVIEDHDISEIKGNQSVTSIVLAGEPPMEISVDGVFILLEQVSNTGVLTDAGIEVDRGGCIITDRNQQTNIPGIYAAGDCCCGDKQIVTAAGGGGQAALSALKFVKQGEAKAR